MKLGHLENLLAGGDDVAFDLSLPHGPSNEVTYNQFGHCGSDVPLSQLVVEHCLQLLYFINFLRAFELATSDLVQEGLSRGQ